jgi:hypothetical protein
VCGSLVWAGALVIGGFAYTTKDDEGWDSFGDALTLALILGPVFLLGIVTAVALGIRLRSPGLPKVGVATWLIAGPPALLGALVALRAVLGRLL